MNGDRDECVRLGFGETGDDTAVVAAFLERRDAWGRSALHWAAVNGAGDAVKALAGLGADVSARDDAGETPVDAAERRARCGAAERPDGAMLSEAYMPQQLEARFGLRFSSMVVDCEGCFDRFRSARINLATSYFGAALTM